MIPNLSTRRIVAASAVAALGLVVVGWIDYAGTRDELLRLLRGQAASLRQTIAAAARANEAAGAQAEAQVTERLLDNARLLAEIDRRGGLTQQYLDTVAAENRLFRASVFAADGSRELSSSGRAASARGGGSRADRSCRACSGGPTPNWSSRCTPRGGAAAPGLRRACAGRRAAPSCSTSMRRTSRRSSGRCRSTA